MTQEDLDNYFEATVDEKGLSFKRRDLIRMLFIGLIVPIGMLLLIYVGIKYVYLLNKKQGDKK